MIKQQNIAPILKIKDLKKSFGDNHVLNGFSMNLYDAENLVLMGKSGSGKSVMIKCVVGLMQADAGIIEIMEKDITSLYSGVWVPFDVSKRVTRLVFSF